MHRPTFAGIVLKSFEFRMTDQSASLNWRQGVAALVVLYAVIVLSSAGADASCGDYVMIGGRQAAEHQLALDHCRSPIPATPQCRGAHCSDHSRPPATPSSRIDTTADDWAICAVFPPEPISNPSAFMFARHRIPCSGYEFDLLRPPR